MDRKLQSPISARSTGTQQLGLPHSNESARSTWLSRGRSTATTTTRMFFHVFSSSVRTTGSMHRHFSSTSRRCRSISGKVAVITDRASPHRSRLVRKFLRANRSVRILYFPKGSPHLNAVEECWHQGKQILLVSEYYRTFSDMCRAVSTYYRTARFNLELLKYANRKTELVCRNL